MGIFLFRAVQELLNNIAKHAHAHKVEIAVFSKDQQTCVSVKNDGVGFEYAEPDPLIAEDYRLGLFSFKERFFTSVVTCWLNLRAAGDVCYPEGAAKKNN